MKSLYTQKPNRFGFLSEVGKLFYQKANLDAMFAMLSDYSCAVLVGNRIHRFFVFFKFKMQLHPKVFLFNFKRVNTF